MVPTECEATTMFQRAGRSSQPTEDMAADFGNLPAVAAGGGDDSNAKRRGRGRMFALLLALCVAAAMGVTVWEAAKSLQRTTHHHRPQHVPSNVKQYVVTMLAAVDKAQRGILGLNRTGRKQSAESLAEIVTEADMASHRTLTELLAKPSHPVVSEEGVATGEVPLLTSDSQEVIFYVDPLDASREYSEGLDEFVSISACLAVCGEPVAAVISFPFTHRVFLALPNGEMQSFDGKQLTNVMARIRDLPQSAYEIPESTCKLSGSCAHRAEARRAGLLPALPVPAAAKRVRSKTASMEALRLMVTRSQYEDTGARSDGLNTLKETMAELQRRYPGATVVRAGGAGFKSAAVADGTTDAYIHEGALRLWDTCAADAIVRAAGGEFTGWKGERIDYCVPPAWFDAVSAPERERVTLGKKAWGGTGVVASLDPRVHDELMRTIIKE